MLASFEAKKHLRLAVADPSTFATTLLTILLDEYGTDLLGWDPRTLASEVSTDYGAQMPPVNTDKIGALITVMTTDRFETDWECFNAACSAFGNEPSDPDLLSPVTPEQMAWGITEAAMSRPDAALELSPEVRRYMGVTLAHNGLLRPPAILEAADIMEPPPAFEGDPELHQAWFASQASDAAWVTDYCRSNTIALIQQLDALPLEHRDSEAWGKFRQRALRDLGVHQPAESSSPVSAKSPSRP